jgi:hypothetical protein
MTNFEVMNSEIFKERARNKFDNWRRIYVRIQGAAIGA